MYGVMLTAPSFGVKRFLRLAHVLLRVAKSRVLVNFSEGCLAISVVTFILGRPGFEPGKAKPAGLQPAPFGRFGTCPKVMV